MKPSYLSISRPFVLYFLFEFCLAWEILWTAYVCMCSFLQIDQTWWFDHCTRLTSFWINSFTLMVYCTGLVLFWHQEQEQNCIIFIYLYNEYDVVAWGCSLAARRSSVPSLGQPGCLSVWSLHVPSMPVWVSPRHSSFRCRLGWLLSYSELPVSVNVFFFVTVLVLWWTSDLSICPPVLLL